LRGTWPPALNFIVQRNPVPHFSLASAYLSSGWSSLGTSA
jgi:hypothetical protein